MRPPDIYRDRGLFPIFEGRTGRRRTMTFPLENVSSRQGSPPRPIAAWQAVKASFDVRKEVSVVNGFRTAEGARPEGSGIITAGSAVGTHFPQEAVFRRGLQPVIERVGHG